MSDPNEIKKLQDEIDKLQKRLNVYEGEPEKISEDEEKKKAKKYFDMFDTDKSGDLDAKEFQQLSFELGETLTLDQAKELIREIDLDKNGKIDFHEFYTWWKSPDHSFLTQSNTGKGKEMMILKAKLTSQSYMRTVSRLANKNQEKVKEKAEEKKEEVSKEEGIATVKAKADVGSMKEGACSVDVVYIEDEEECKKHRQYLNSKSDSVILTLSLTVRPEATDFRLGEMAGALKIVLDASKKEFLIERNKIELATENNVRVMKVHIVWDKNKDNKDTIEDIQQVIEALHPKSASASLVLDQSPQNQKPDQTLNGKGTFDAKMYRSSVELLKEILEVEEDEEGLQLFLKLLQSVKNLDLSFKFDTFHDLYSKMIKENKKGIYGELNWPEGWDFGLNFWANVKPLLLSPIVEIFNDIASDEPTVSASILESYYDSLGLFKGLASARLQMGSLALAFTAKDLDLVHLLPNREELVAFDKNKQKKKKKNVYSYSRNKKSLFYDPDKDKEDDKESVSSDSDSLLGKWSEKGTKTLTFANIGDKKGVIETLKKSQHPATATPSSENKNSTEFLNPTNIHCWTKNLPNSWFMVDLGEGRRLTANKYTFRYASVGSAVCPRNWKFQGSNSSADLAPDSSGWVTLHEAKDNKQFEDQKKDYPALAFSVSASQGFRFFRIIQTGPNCYKPKKEGADNWSNVLVAGGFEAYGKLELGVAEPKSNIFKFGFQNDTNGIVNHLVKDKNPPKVVSSSQDRGLEKDFIERGQTVHCWTQNKPNSFFLVDFGKGTQIAATHYSWRYGSSVPAKASACCARSWKLQGSNDDSAKTDFSPSSSKWTTLDDQSNNTTLSGAWSTYDSSLDSSKGKFRYFRLIQTGKNASSSSNWCHVFVASGFEIYGDLTQEKEESKKKKTSAIRKSSLDSSDFLSDLSSDSFSW